MRNPQLVYQQQSVKNASPLQLVVKMYDLVIQATYREDDKRVRDLLSTLISGLNFDHEPADQLFSLYKYCQDLSRKGDYEEIREILEPLRDTWDEVANRTSANVLNADTKVN
jgi:flagellin-specific chaperone FliS